jgi:hypothetical protein
MVVLAIKALAEISEIEKYLEDPVLIRSENKYGIP